ncbi:hypothetical protein Peur_046836 [Populus x canadensis]|jgi:hypothetical protein
MTTFFILIKETQNVTSVLSKIPSSKFTDTRTAIDISFFGQEIISVEQTTLIFKIAFTYSNHIQLSKLIRELPTIQSLSQGQFQVEQKIKKKILKKIK